MASPVAYQAVTRGKLEWKGQELMLFVGFCETFNREAEGEPCLQGNGTKHGLPKTLVESLILGIF